MIADPVTLGISGNLTVFNLSELGPGARTTRLQSTDEVFNQTTLKDMKLTISHGVSGTKGRVRSLFRVDVHHNGTTAESAGIVQDAGDSAAYIVLDTPEAQAPGGSQRGDVALWLFARLLGFLSENATAAPDFDFSSNENVLKFVAREP